VERFDLVHMPKMFLSEDAFGDRVWRALRHGGGLVLPTISVSGNVKDRIGSGAPTRIGAARRMRRRRGFSTKLGRLRS
jgi:hypothetical protein